VESEAGAALMTLRTAPVFLIGLILAGCGRNPEPVISEKPVGAATGIRAPLGLPPVPVPPGNPVTVETIALGRKLFHDPILSMNDTVSCASCHNPRLGFADGRKASTGVDGKTGTRNAPTVVNAAYGRIQFWDGRAESLEDQAGGPIANPLEMNQGHDVCVAKLENDPRYKAEFQKAFGPGPITIGKLQNAIAAFERTLISGNSPFDRYRFGGDKTALNAAAVRGLEIFTDAARGNCATCHTIEKEYALFTDSKFHNLGVGLNPEGEFTDLGRFMHTKVETDKGAFKTPMLRNIADTAPYMHDGSLKTLRDVVDFYAGGGNSNEYLDKDIKQLKLTARERADLVAFLESLTGEISPDALLSANK
jgi:cytochrome c peroxidase